MHTRVRPDVLRPLVKGKIPVSAFNKNNMAFYFTAVRNKPCATYVINM